MWPPHRVNRNRTPCFCSTSPTSSPPFIATSGGGEVTRARLFGGSAVRHRNHALAAIAVACLACGGLELPGADPLAQARLAVVAGADTPADPCHAYGWVRVALRELGAALDADPTLLPAIDADPGLTALTSTPAYARWREGRATDLSSDAAIQQIVADAGGWHDATGGPVSLSLLPAGSAFLGREDSARTMSGTWRVVDGEVELVLGGTSLHAALVPGELGLVLDAGAFGTFMPEPRVCP